MALGRCAVIMGLPVIEFAGVAPFIVLLIRRYPFALGHSRQSGCLST